MTTTRRPDIQVLRQRLTAIVGDTYVTDDAKMLAVYGQDWTSLAPNPSLVVRPANTQEVSRVMEACYSLAMPVVPVGGRTGLAGGAVSTQGELALSLDRLNSIEPIDTVGHVMTVGAGAILQDIHSAAAEQGYFYGVDLAAKGSCQIGGNIATNAGGLKLIRYGGTREQIVGLEVVLADGRILDLSHNLVKNNTGYDLKQLMIGSEGTLGIITKALLRLQPPPKSPQLGLMALESFDGLPKLLKLLHHAGVVPLAVEFFTHECLELVCQTNPSAHRPFESETPIYVLLELEDREDGSSNDLEAIFASAHDAGVVVDGVLATSQNHFHELWFLRENISESVSVSGLVRKNDVSVPLKDLSDFLHSLEELIKVYPYAIRLLTFGHIGDGNVHLNYLAPKDYGVENFAKHARELEEQIFDLVSRYGGSISAEHGIGLLKKADLSYTCSEVEVAVMRAIKSALDPKTILNPGKVFDL